MTDDPRNVAGAGTPDAAGATPRGASYDVTALGETMLRLSVPAGERLDGGAGFDAHVGGAESNVLAALAALGRRCGYVSAVPDSPLGTRVVTRLRAAGIDTAAVVRSPGTRLGTYFIEPGVPPRAGEVIYDRQGSAAAMMRDGSVAWDRLLDTRLIHLTGITPALGEGPRALAASLLIRAREAGVAVSFDVNHRSKLWSASDAAAWITEHARGVQILVCGRADAEALFGLAGGDGDVLAALAQRLDATTTILTRGGEGAVALVDGTLVDVPAREAVVIDRIGAGDAFTAGVLDGWLDGDVAAGLARGAAMGALALAQRGDMLGTSRAEVDAIAAAAARPGDVRR